MMQKIIKFNNWSFTYIEYLDHVQNPLPGLISLYTYHYLFLFSIVNNSNVLCCFVVFYYFYTFYNEFVGCYIFYRIIVILFTIILYIIYDFVQILFY